MRFVLSIELGNDAMRTRGNVAKALHAVARAVRLAKPLATMTRKGPTKILDVNGNSVGTWEVTKD